VKGGKINSGLDRWAFRQMRGDITGDISARRKCLDAEGGFQGGLHREGENGGRWNRDGCMGKQQRMDEPLVGKDEVEKME